MFKQKNYYLILGLLLPVLVFGLIFLTNAGFKPPIPKYNYIYMEYPFNYTGECNEYWILENGKINFRKSETIINEGPSVKVACNSKLFIHNVTTNSSTQIANQEAANYELLDKSNTFKYYDASADPDGFMYSNYYNQSGVFPFFLGFQNSNRNNIKVLFKDGYIIDQNIAGDNIGFISFVK
jgi:hypothetical protein